MYVHICLIKLYLYRNDVCRSFSTRISAVYNDKKSVNSFMQQQRTNKIKYSSKKEYHKTYILLKLYCYK